MASLLKYPSLRFPLRLAHIYVWGKQKRILSDSVSYFACSAGDPGKGVPGLGSLDNLFAQPGVHQNMDPPPNKKTHDMFARGLFPCPLTPPQSSWFPFKATPKRDLSRSLGSIYICSLFVGLVNCKHVSDGPKR